MAEHFIAAADAEHDLLACAAFVAESIGGGDGLAEAMKVVVPRYLETNSVDLAAELANAVEDPFTRDMLLIAVAEKCAAVGDDEYALQLADAIEDEGLRSQCLERVAIQKSAGGDTVSAANIAESISHPDYVYADIAVREAERGDETAFNSALDKIEFPAARVAALHAIASTKVKDGKRDDALRFLNDAFAAANDTEHQEEQLRALCEIGGAFIEADDKEDAIRTFEVARENAEQLGSMHRDLFLATVALGFLQAGNLDQADQTLDLVADKTQIASCLLGFSREFWKREEKDEALETLEEAYEILKSQRENEIRDSRSRNALYTQVAAQYAGYGKADRAIEIAQKNLDENERRAALAQIAQILTIQRDDNLARQALAAIDEESNRLFALLGMSEAKVQIGERENAVALLDEAATLAETVPHLSQRSSVLNEIARSFYELGENLKAAAVSHESLNVIASIRDKSIQSIALANLSAIYPAGEQQLSEDDQKVIEKIIGRARLG
jgi:tetratricopeptide (TPR) repeat protein